MSAPDVLEPDVPEPDVPVLEEPDVFPLSVDLSVDVPDEPEDPEDPDVPEDPVEPPDPDPVEPELPDLEESDPVLPPVELPGVLPPVEPPDVLPPVLPEDGVSTFLLPESFCIVGSAPPEHPVNIAAPKTPISRAKDHFFLIIPFPPETSHQQSLFESICFRNTGLPNAEASDKIQYTREK
ncbi:MAG: hypothetical protein K0R28_2087 [Paenibacillus sp.]|nr:hypothetical protein [Paenibacillus sp.]